MNLIEPIIYSSHALIIFKAIISNTEYERTCVCQITLSIANHKSIHELEHDYKNARVYQLSSKLIYGHRIIDARNVMNQWECLQIYSFKINLTTP